MLDGRIIYKMKTAIKLEIIMEKYFKVQVSYPDGKVEMIEEDFEKGADALEYGNSLLAQIAINQNYHEGAIDEFGEETLKNPYFFIIEVYDDKQAVVYDSRKA